MNHQIEQAWDRQVYGIQVYSALDTFQQIVVAYKSCHWPISELLHFPHCWQYVFQPIREPLHTLLTVCFSCKLPEAASWNKIQNRLQRYHVTSFQQAAGLTTLISTHQGYLHTLTLVCCSRVVAVACSTIGTRKSIEVETVRVGLGSVVGRVSVPYRGNSVAGSCRSAAWKRIHLYGCSSQQVQDSNNFHLDQQWQVTRAS